MDWADINRKAVSKTFESVGNNSGANTIKKVGNTDDQRKLDSQW